MVIYAPELTTGGESVCVSARIQIQTPGTNLPDVLWFQFPARFVDFVIDRTDGFVASLILLAMVPGEDVQVPGTVSPRLAFGLDEYQRIFNLWFPMLYKKIAVNYEALEPAVTSQVQGKVAAPFSGGVDSFFTLWSHLEQNELHTGFRINYAIFAHGFDIPLKDAETFRVCEQAYSRALQEMGVDLVTVRTNVRQFLKTADWRYTHGAALSAVPLILGRLVTRFYVPGDYTYADIFPWGSDPRLEPWLATETFESFYDGGGTPRIKKLAVLSKWPATYDLLRVCWKKPSGLMNCCRCSKCLRNMVALDLLGTLDKYTTFPLPLERRAVRRLVLTSQSEYPFARSILKYALAAGRGAHAFDMRYVMFKSGMIGRVNAAKREMATRVAALNRRIKSKKFCALRSIH